MTDIKLIINEIDRLIDSKNKIIISIEGRSASGKTTLGVNLSEIYDSNLFHMDDFFLAANQKTDMRLKEAGGNVDYIRFKEDIMEKLMNNQSFNYQIFDCKLQALTEERTITPKKINIIEGAYSMHPSLIDNYDLKIFLDIDDETQKERIRKRNGKEIYKKFINEWIPLEDRYFNQLDIRNKADIVIKA